MYGILRLRVIWLLYCLLLVGRKNKVMPVVSRVNRLRMKSHLRLE